MPSEMGTSEMKKSNGNRGTTENSDNPKGRNSTDFYGPVETTQMKSSELLMISMLRVINSFSKICASSF